MPLVFPSHHCGRFCRRPCALRRATSSVFMRVAALEHLVQNHVGRRWSSRADVSNWKQMVGERGFEPPTPWSRTRCSTRLSHSPTVLGRGRNCGRPRETCRLTLAIIASVKLASAWFAWRRSPADSYFSGRPQGYRAFDSTADECVRCYVSLWLSPALPPATIGFRPRLPHANRSHCSPSLHSGR